MVTKLNLHKLMGTDEGYLAEIRVPERDRVVLTTAREKIRDTLRSAFRNWHHFVSRIELQDSLVVASATPRLPTPKFRIQGSFAYHTANDCQNPPDQQIDQDDGVYLPISFVTVNGRARPTIASSTYFRIVERALGPLCEAQGWRLNPGKAKNSCVRVEIDWRLHIDLPLYAIRDEAFEQLVEVAAVAKMAKASEIRDSRELDERIYRDLAAAEIILAHRSSGWIESDPRRLEKWFRAAIDLYGSQVRDLSRCFKGLRDARLDDGLSSICIMASVVRAIENLGGLDAGRLDLAIVSAAREIARLADQPVENPVFPGDAAKHLCLGWTPQYRKRVRSLFAEAADELEAAIDGTFHKTIALARARKAFGARVPEREDLIAAVGAVEMVRSTPAQRQPAALVPRTKSG
ncbi:CBASS cGAMP synthase [Flavisphingomonas formosensis]|uniref:CBASS cGAMP synthase n=1 Tax=Flavisphingomonas formosensis TaxID=861534 RepID=UPI0012FD0030|nr:hypothetical protein [Sphingomonas formosensis]